MKVAILGAGHGGVAASADLTLKGHEVTLFESEQFSHTFNLIREKKEIVVNEAGQSQTVKIAGATHDPEQAVAGARLVLVIVPSFAQQEIARQCAPFLADEQFVFILPGGFGSYLFKKELARHGKNPVLGETATLPYGARKSSDNEVNIHIRTIFNPFAAFPAAKNEEATSLLQEIYPEVKTMTSVLDVALNNTNPCVHPVPVILSASRIEFAGDDFWLYREAMTPLVWKVMRKVDEERVKVREGYGLGEPHCRLPEETGKIFVDQFGYHEGIKAGEKMKGPDRLDHRYITEDVPMGLVFYSEMGKLVNVATPVTDAIIELASELLGQNFREEGRNLAALGLENYKASTLIKELQ